MNNELWFYRARAADPVGWTAGSPPLSGRTGTCSNHCWWSSGGDCPASGGHRPRWPGWTLSSSAWTQSLRKTKHTGSVRVTSCSIKIQSILVCFYILITNYYMCESVPTLCEVALRQSVSDVWKLAAVVAVLQRADVHVPPLLQLLEPGALLLTFTVGV